MPSTPKIYQNPQLKFRSVLSTTNRVGTHSIAKDMLRLTTRQQTKRNIEAATKFDGVFNHIPYQSHASEPIRIYVYTFYCSIKVNHFTH